MVETTLENLEAISLDNIDTTAAWRVETESLSWTRSQDWLGVDLEDVAVAEEGEPEIEEEAEQHQGQEAVAELDEDAEEEVTPSRMGSSRGQR